MGWNIWHSGCLLTCKRLPARHPMQPFFRKMTMTKLTQLKAIAAAAGTCAAMLSAAPAHAFVYSTSALRIDDLTIIIGNNANTEVPSFVFGLSNSATMPGSGPVASSASCSQAGGCGVNPVLDAVAVNGTGSTQNRIENNFSFLAQAPAIRMPAQTRSSRPLHWSTTSRPAPSKSPSRCSTPTALRRRTPTSSRPRRW